VRCGCAPGKCCRIVIAKYRTVSPYFGTKVQDYKPLKSAAGGRRHGAGAGQPADGDGAGMIGLSGNPRTPKGGRVGRALATESPHSASGGGNPHLFWICPSVKEWPPPDHAGSVCLCDLSSAVVHLLCTGCIGRPQHEICLSVTTHLAVLCCRKSSGVHLSVVAQQQPWV
jgi:hypothetical protein